MANRIKRVPSSKRSAPIFSRFKKFGDLDFVKSQITTEKNKIKRILNGILLRIEKRPIRSFFTLLAILFVLILVGSFIRKPKTAAPETPKPKQVSIYSIGVAPKVTVAAKVEKAGVVKIVAQTNGIVSNIAVTEGQTVDKGTTLINLASNYDGGNAASVQRQLAATQYQTAKDTYDTQKNIIQKNRDLANQQADNAEALRQITATSVDETQSLINLNSTILTPIKTQILTLQANNPNGINDAQIASLETQQSQLQAGTNQLQQAARNAAYATNTNNPPTQMANISKEVALSQLDIQEKTLKMSLEISSLQLTLAQISESMMAPTAPFDGTVERIYVSEGQNVTPGTVLLQFHADATAKLIAGLPKDIAQKVSLTQSSTIHLPGHTIQIIPTYVSAEATEGNLNAIIFTLPSENQKYTNNQSFVTVDIPVGYAATGSVVPFVPIDSIYQSQSASYLFVDQNGIAVSKKVTLGNVVGEYVQVTQGLVEGDQVILDRNVIAGDKVTPIP